MLNPNYHCVAGGRREWGGGELGRVHKQAQQPQPPQQHRRLTEQPPHLLAPLPARTVPLTNRKWILGKVSFVALFMFLFCLLKNRKFYFR